MRELRVISVEADGGHVVVQDDETKEKFRIRADDRLRAAARGDLSRLGQIQIEMESTLRPREIQARIRAGATVEEVAAIAGVSPDRVERFAHPVLLERARAAELASLAHPIREDGPAVASLGEVVDTALAARGHSAVATEWDAWKGDDGFWVVQVRWQVGRTDNYAHWRFHPGAHGGTADPLDDLADELTDPEAVAVQRRRLAPVSVPQMSRPAHSRTVAESVTVDAGAVVGRHHGEDDTGESVDVIDAQVVDDVDEVPESADDPSPEFGGSTEETLQLGFSVVGEKADHRTTDSAQADTGTESADEAKPRRRKQRKPSVPAWEDVLLGVRSNPNS
ncbi:septation protein SepH [Gordonia sp. CPCC 205333]|uniref:septation protein SepH n=1 Tax=Gordonia sp. CPCC 205333 TaxID=3140790 RepID=UPI003AF34DF0